MKKFNPVPRVGARVGPGHCNLFVYYLVMPYGLRCSFACNLLFALVKIYAIPWPGSLELHAAGTSQVHIPAFLHLQRTTQMPHFIHLTDLSGQRCDVFCIRSRALILRRMSVSMRVNHNINIHFFLNAAACVNNTKLGIHLTKDHFHYCLLNRKGGTLST